MGAKFSCITRKDFLKTIRAVKTLSAHVWTSSSAGQTQRISFSGQKCFTLSNTTVILMFWLFYTGQRNCNSPSIADITELYQVPMKTLTLIPSIIQALSVRFEIIYDIYRGSMLECQSQWQSLHRLHNAKFHYRPLDLCGSRNKIENYWKHYLWLRKDQTATWQESGIKPEPWCR